MLIFTEKIYSFAKKTGGKEEDFPSTCTQAVLCQRNVVRSTVKIVDLFVSRCDRWGADICVTCDMDDEGFIYFPGVVITMPNSTPYKPQAES